MPEAELDTNTDDSTESVASDVDVNFVDDNPQNTDLAPGPDGKQEEVKEPTPEETQRVLEDRLAEEKFERRRERREREEAQHELAQLRSEQSAQTAERPNVPDLPDSFDDDFSKRMTERDKALREAERFDARADFEQQQQVEMLQQAQTQQAQEIQAKSTTFRERANKAGITDTELQQNGQRLINYQVLSAEEAELILDHEDGPLIAKYLAENPSELESIAALPVGSIQRSVKIVTEIREKASALKAKTTATPDPLDPIRGNSGVAGQDSLGPPGATYM